MDSVRGLGQQRVGFTFASTISPVRISYTRPLLVRPLREHVPTKPYDYRRNGLSKPWHIVCRNDHRQGDNIHA